jgi:hypothetical protein
MIRPKQIQTNEGYLIVNYKEDDLFEELANQFNPNKKVDVRLFKEKISAS